MVLRPSLPDIAPAAPSPWPRHPDRSTLALTRLGDVPAAKLLLPETLQDPGWRQSQVAQEWVGLLLLAAGHCRSAHYFLRRGAKGRSFYTSPESDIHFAREQMRHRGEAPHRRSLPADAAIEAELQQLLRSV